MEVYSHFEGTNIVFKLIGELDEHEAEFVRRKLDNELTTADYTAVIFDLSRLSFMDSTGIGVIIGRYKIAKKRNKGIFGRPDNEGSAHDVCGDYDGNYRRR